MLKWTLPSLGMGHGWCSLASRGEVWAGRMLGPRMEMAGERIIGAHTGELGTFSQSQGPLRLAECWSLLHELL